MQQWCQLRRSIGSCLSCLLHQNVVIVVVKTTQQSHGAADAKVEVWSNSPRNCMSGKELSLLITLYIVVQGTKTKIIVQQKDWTVLKTQLIVIVLRRLWSHHLMSNHLPNKVLVWWWNRKGQHKESTRGITLPSVCKQKIIILQEANCCHRLEKKWQQNIMSNLVQFVNWVNILTN